MSDEVEQQPEQPVEVEEPVQAEEPRRRRGGFNVTLTDDLKQLLKEHKETYGTKHYRSMLASLLSGKNVEEAHETALKNKDKTRRKKRKVALDVMQEDDDEE